MKRAIKTLALLCTVLLSACAAGSGKQTPEAGADNRPIPPIDRGIPKELARATFAMG